MNRLLRSKLFIWSGFVLVLSMSTGTLADSIEKLSGREIMSRNEKARKVSDVKSDARLETGGESKKTRVKEFTWWRKLALDQQHFNTLTRFHRPAQIRGEGILFLEKQGEDNEVLMYLPAYKKIRRVESQQQSGSFMGSVFSYSDITVPHVDDYEHEYLKAEKCGVAGSEEVECYVVSSKPANEKVKTRTGYSKTVAWVRSDNFMVAKAEYFNFEGKLFKKMKSDQIQNVDSKKNLWMALKVEMEDLQKNRYTRLVFSDVKVNRGLEDNLFTRQELSRP